MNKLTQKIIDELNRQYGCSFFAFSEKGLTIKFSDELKEFFDEYDIKSEMDFSNHFGSFRDFLCIPKGMDMVSFCSDNDKLYPKHFGMTNAPLFGFNGLLGCEESPVEYAFMYFNSYQVLDWVEVLIESEEVTFETFIDNSDEYEKAQQIYIEQQGE